MALASHNCIDSLAKQIWFQEAMDFLPGYLVPEPMLHEVPDFFRA